MRIISRDIEGRYVEAAYTVAAFADFREGRASNRRWRTLVPVLAVAFAPLISSCDNDSQKTDVNRLAEVFEFLDEKSEHLLGPDKVTATEAEVRRERYRNRRETTCIITDSEPTQNEEQPTANTQQLRFKVVVPVRPGTYEQRKKEAESPESRRKLIDCYKAFKIDLPPQLLAADEELPIRNQTLLGVGVARANNGTCLSAESGSCGGASTPPYCCP